MSNRVRQQPLLAFAVALAAVGVLSLMDAVMKGLTIALGIYAVSLWRSLSSALLGAALYLPTRRGWPDRATIRLHLARGAVITVMGVLFFWGLARTPMAQAIALTFIAPLLSLFLAAAVLGETIGRRVVAGSLAAFAGVVLILAGQARADLSGPALAGSAAILASAVCYAVNIVMMRRQAQAARPPEIGFFQNLTIAALMVAALPLVGPVGWPAGHVGAILLASALSFAGILLFAFAYARGPASYLSVTEYSGFLWAAALGWLVFGERVSALTTLGALLIVGGCLFAARSDRREESEMEALA